MILTRSISRSLICLGQCRKRDCVCVCVRLNRISQIYLTSLSLLGMKECNEIKLPCTLILTFSHDVLWIFDDKPRSVCNKTCSTLSFERILLPCFNRFHRASQFDMLRSSKNGRQCSITRLERYNEIFRNPITQIMKNSEK